MSMYISAELVNFIYLFWNLLTYMDEPITIAVFDELILLQHAMHF